MIPLITKLIKDIYEGEFDKLGDLKEHVTWTEDSTVIEEPASRIGTLAVTSREISHDGVLGLFGLDLVKYRVLGKYEYNAYQATNALSI